MLFVYGNWFENNRLIIKKSTTISNEITCLLCLFTFPPFIADFANVFKSLAFCQTQLLFVFAFVTNCVKEHNKLKSNWIHNIKQNKMINPLVTMRFSELIVNYRVCVLESQTELCKLKEFCFCFVCYWFFALNKQRWLKNKGNENNNKSSVFPNVTNNQI